MHPDTAERLLWALAALGYAMAIVGLLGEYLGWWNDVGELLTSWGTLLGIVMTASSIAVNADKDQVQAVRTGVETTHEKLDSMDGKLSKLDKLDSMDTKLDKLDELDVIQAELDRQTGAMDEQTRVLRQIRDAI